MEPSAQPATFSGMRALNSVLESQDLVDKTLMFNIKLVHVDKPGLGQNGYNLDESFQSENVSALQTYGNHVEYFTPGLVALSSFVLSLIGLVKARNSQLRNLQEHLIHS